MKRKSSKNISRLDLSTSSWTKNDWIRAAKLLAGSKKSGTVRGLINQAMYEGFITDVSDRVLAHGTLKNKGAAKFKGRPIKWTKIMVEELLLSHEERKNILARKNGTDPSKITDVTVAKDFAFSEDSSEFRKNTRLSKSQTFYRTQQIIKYMKQKVKTG